MEKTFRTLVTGGAGFLGRAIVKQLLKVGQKDIIVFSRDEAKKHNFRIELENLKSPTDEVIYNDTKVKFIVGDIRDYNAIEKALEGVDLCIHTAALKQVPVCEKYPMEAVMTNVIGSQNLIRACQKQGVKKVIGISSDKACEPITVYGMTKAIMERLFMNAKGKTQFVLVRYGNVILSTGSVLPLWQEQKKNGQPLSITDKKMKRYFLTVEEAIKVIDEAIKGQHGEIIVPKLTLQRMYDIAMKISKDIKITGVRPNEKIEEKLIGEAEKDRVFERNGYFVIPNML